MNKQQPKKDNSEEDEIKLRWYQEESVDSLMSYFDTNEGHPIVVAPTGAGKSLILCEFVNQYLSDYPGSKILVLSHVKEILQQDHDALTSYFHGYEVGLWSAGLNSKTKKMITVGGIQSIYRSHNQFQDINIVIIDECHLINTESQGMYRKFLGNLPLANYVGLTATPFRLGQGYIHKGKDALFTDIVYDLSSVENYNRLVDEVYLSKMISKATDAKWDTSDIKIRAGDFREEDMSDKFDREEITNEAVLEIIKYGKNYKCWLVFAIDINHAEHIANKFRSYGIKTACVHSKMEGDRDKVITDIKNGKYRCVINVNVLTTGFDAPNIDLIALLRPTKSPVLHVQSIGRGARVVIPKGYPDTIQGRKDAIDHGPKNHCLVLDFAGNIERLGPINNVKVKEKSGKGDAPVKKCPTCDVYNPVNAKKCDVCGHIFDMGENKQERGAGALRNRAGSAEVVQKSRNNTEQKAWYDVDSISYKIHSKKGKPSSLKVSYKCGYYTFNEWICIDHPPGFAKHRAQAWIRYRLDGRQPANLQELYSLKHLLKQPKKIYVNRSGNFPNIMDSKFD